MHQTLSPCGCNTDDCWTFPAEFMRVRYFYGQRLGVMELTDQASYHAGKHAFHNARLHGAGVLCGLRAERMPLPAGGATTVLAVRRGAALDPCGRDIIVGVDQCIDIRAWFDKNKGRPELAAWTANTTQHLHIAIRYRECPTDPSPAPRDPCGCDNGGCEFGRVREGFELTLFTDAEKTQCTDVSFPATAELLGAFDRSGSIEALGAAIATLIAGDCPGPVDDAWLCLASFDVVLDATPVPTDVTNINNAVAERRSLLSTSALQTIALSMAQAGVDTGAIGAGPRITGVAFTATGPAAGTIELPIVLAKSGTPPADVPLVAGTFDPALVALRRLDPAGAWVDLTPPPANITLVTAPTPRIAVKVGAGLSAGPRYLVALDSAPGKPLVDAEGRLLRPQPFARLIAFVPDGANLKLDPQV